MKSILLFWIFVLALVAVLLCAQEVPSYETAARTFFTNYARQVMGPGSTIESVQIFSPEGTNFVEGTAFTNGQSVIVIGDGFYASNRNAWAGYIKWTMGTNVPVPVIPYPLSLQVTNK